MECCSFLSMVVKILVQCSHWYTWGFLLCFLRFSGLVKCYNKGYKWGVYYTYIKIFLTWPHTKHILCLEWSSDFWWTFSVCSSNLTLDTNFVSQSCSWQTNLCSICWCLLILLADVKVSRHSWQVRGALLTGLEGMLVPCAASLCCSREALLVNLRLQMQLKLCSRLMWSL